MNNAWTFDPDRTTRHYAESIAPPAWSYVECAPGLDTATSLADWRASNRPAKPRKRWWSL